MELTDDELRITIYLISSRLKHESKRKPRLDLDGNDMQYTKVRNLQIIREKLQNMRKTGEKGFTSNL